MTHSLRVDSLLQRRLDRRDLLTGGLALLGLGAARRAPGRSLFQPSAFPLGVASGDPTPDGVVLWTRLALDPLNGGGMPPDDVEVVWEVARDEGMTDVARRGTSVASGALGHSVHVEVDGLEPGRWYWYRFRAGTDESAVGRTRTLPAAGARPDRLRFAFASCQHYEHGYYTAYRHMAEDDLDLVFHLGDYIYEGAASDGRVRRHTGGENELLDEYRNRYALYRGDPDLQAAHAAFPWVVTWDDHEVDNNYANAVSEEEGLPAELFLRRRAAAYQAYYEHMPLRRSSLPAGPDLQLYRAFDWGDLASVHVLDTRQYRTDQPCGDGRGACDGMFDPAATPLGEAQERWLLDGLDGSAARWNVVPQADHDGAYRLHVGRWRVLRARHVVGLRGRAPPADGVPRRAPDRKPDRAHRRHPQQLGQRPQGRLPRPRRAGGRHRARRHLHQLERRRRRRPRLDRGAPRREPGHQVLQRPARLRALRVDPGAVPGRLPGPGVRHPAGQPHLDARVVHRRGRPARRAAALSAGLPVPNARHRSLRGRGGTTGILDCVSGS